MATLCKVPPHSFLSLISLFEETSFIQTRSGIRRLRSSSFLEIVLPKRTFLINQFAQENCEILKISLEKHVVLVVPATFYLPPLLLFNVCVFYFRIVFQYASHNKARYTLWNVPGPENVPQRCGYQSKIRLVSLSVLYIKLLGRYSYSAL